MKNLPLAISAESSALIVEGTVSAALVTLLQTTAQPYLKKGLEVLLLVILLSIGIGASFGCLNYATYAKELGKPDGFFWFVGIAEITITLFYSIRRFKQLMAE